MERKQSGTGGDSTDRVSPSGGGWVFPALLAGVLIVTWGVAQLGPTGKLSKRSGVPAVAWLPTPQPQGETVAMTLDFGNGAKQLFEALPWHEGMTVEKLMREAALFRPGITFVQQGEQETGLLQSINGLKNQGGIGRNWKYEVNGRYATVGFCVQKLEPGDRVLWEFVDQE